MTEKQRAALEQAAQAWEMWLKLERDQDEWMKTHNGKLASWPRDCYESWLDDLAYNAKEALNENNDSGADRQSRQ